MPTADDDRFEYLNSRRLQKMLHEIIEEYLWVEIELTCPAISYLYIKKRRIGSFLYSDNGKAGFFPRSLLGKVYLGFFAFT